jgi:hypothetical protein
MLSALFLMFLTFAMTTAGYGLLLWLAYRRISRHLQGNATAVQAVTDHVLLPLLGCAPAEQREAWSPNEPAPPPAGCPNERPHPR